MEERKESGHRLQPAGVEHVVVDSRRRDHVAARVAVLPTGAAAALVLHRLEHHEPARPASYEPS